jgi:hypothetical protein
VLAEAELSPSSQRFAARLQCRTCGGVMPLALQGVLIGSTGTGSAASLESHHQGDSGEAARPSHRGGRDHSLAAADSGAALICEACEARLSQLAGPVMAPVSRAGRLHRAGRLRRVSKAAKGGALMSGGTSRPRRRATGRGTRQPPRAKGTASAEAATTEGGQELTAVRMTGGSRERVVPEWGGGSDGDGWVSGRAAGGGDAGPAEPDGMVAAGGGQMVDGRLNLMDQLITSAVVLRRKQTSGGGQQGGGQQQQQQQAAGTGDAAAAEQQQQQQQSQPQERLRINTPGAVAPDLNDGGASGGRAASGPRQIGRHTAPGAMTSSSGAELLESSDFSVRARSPWALAPRNQAPPGSRGAAAAATPESASRSSRSSLRSPATHHGAKSLRASVGGAPPPPPSSPPRARATTTSGGGVGGGGSPAVGPGGGGGGGGGPEPRAVSARWPSSSSSSSGGGGSSTRPAQPHQAPRSRGALGGGRVGGELPPSQQQAAPSVSALAATMVSK